MKGCYSSGELRAYLDGELAGADGHRVRDHVRSCPGCARAVAQLRETEQVLTAALTGYARELEKTPMDSEKAWRQFSSAPKQRKGRMSALRTYRKGIMTAAAVAVLAVALSLAPVREAAAGFLTIFRVEKIQTVTLDPNDLVKISNALRAGNAQVDLHSLGKVEVTGKQAAATVNREDLLRSAGFSVRIPASRPEGYAGPTYRLRNATSVNFTFNAQKINELMKSLGSAKLFPPEVDGQTITLALPPQAVIEYLPVSEARGRITVMESRGPELRVPPGVDVGAIREALLALPVLPQDLRTQLASIRDWQHTAVIPAIKGVSQEVAIGGHTGIFTPRGDSHGSLVWENSGVLFGIDGPLTLEQSLALANSLR